MPETTPFAFAGSVSHGTHVSRHILTAFLPVLSTLDTEKKYRGLVCDGHGYLNLTEPTEKDESDASDIIAEILDAIDALAPEGYTFGAREGDGSDFGFWEAPKAFDAPEYTVNGTYLSAIINDDYSGLDDDEAAALRAWIDKEATENGSGHWDTDSEDEGSFTTCDVCGLYAKCHTLRYVQMG